MARIIRKLIVSIVLFATLAGAALAYWSYAIAHQPLQISKSDTLFEVERGMHMKSVIRKLQQQHMLQGEVEVVYFASRVWSQPQQLQAGVYAIQPGMRLTDLWSLFASGEQHKFQITLVEGQTLAQWLQQLNAHPYLKPISDAAWQQLEQRLKPEQWPSLEGALAPDTYSFYAGSKVETIIEMAFLVQQKWLENAWSQRSERVPLKDPYELLIMASMIEKETGMKAERELVSSVFVNRLHAGMRLQSDPTTIYGIKNFDGNLTRAHLRELTPYNTYRIDGLPPTPIAMPSAASLYAAAQPAVSPYYYFVADGSGGHVFSETLEQHNRAVNRYQRGISN